MLSPISQVIPTRQILLLYTPYFTKGATEAHHLYTLSGVRERVKWPMVYTCSMTYACGLPFYFYFYFAGIGDPMKCYKGVIESDFRKLAGDSIDHRLKSRKVRAIRKLVPKTVRTAGLELMQQPGDGEERAPKEQSFPRSGPFLHIHYHFPLLILKSSLQFSSTIYCFQTPHISI